MQLNSKPNSNYGHHFHNTTGQHNSEVQTSEEKAKSQDDKVLGVFRQHPTKEFTPAEIYKKLLAAKLITSTTPITSIRRAISNLTKEPTNIPGSDPILPHLIKTAKKRAGLFGAENRTWQLNPEKYHIPVQQTLELN